MNTDQLLAALGAALNETGFTHGRTPSIAIGVCTTSPAVFDIFRSRCNMPDGILDQPTVFGTTVYAGPINLHLFGPLDSLCDRVMVDRSLVTNFDYLLKLPVDADAESVVS